MILRTLRARRNWTQEQLAEFSGLSVRTIQRIERGNTASLESLKCLAAVLEVDLSTLKEDITVIDKTSERWKALPLWIRANYWGIQTRSSLVRGEIMLIICALLAWAGTLFREELTPVPPVMFLLAYMLTLMIRYGDRQQIWSGKG